jgi:hypothetical protein
MAITIGVVGLNLTYAQDNGSTTGSRSKSKTTMSKDSTKKGKSGKKHHTRSKKSSRQSKTQNTNK